MSYHEKMLHLRLYVMFQYRTPRGEWALGIHTRGIGLGISFLMWSVGISLGGYADYFFGPGISYYPPNRLISLYLTPSLWVDFVLPSFLDRKRLSVERDVR